MAAALASILGGSPVDPDRGARMPRPGSKSQRQKAQRGQSRFVGLVTPECNHKSNKARQREREAQAKHRRLNQSRPSHQKLPTSRAKIRAYYKRMNSDGTLEPTRAQLKRQACH